MFSVIVATYNNPDIEARCVRSLLASDLAHEARLVVVDDCSSSPPPPGLRSDDIYMRQPQRRGPHAAWNAGIRACAPDDFFLIGSDVVVQPDTLRLLRDYALTCPAGLVAAADHKASIETVPRGDLSRPPTPIPGIESCCHIRREAWDRVGGFDEQFFLTFGDADWNQRAADIGVECLRLPGVFVYHGCSVSRKREGVDADLAKDRADHRRFLAKWVRRPDVTARHPMAPLESARAAKAYFWSIEGEK